MIKRPPVIDGNPLTALDELANPESKRDYLAWLSPLDAKGRYLHYDELRFKLKKNLDPELAWSVVKLSRRAQLKDIIQLGEPCQSGKLLLTPTIQRAISECDRHTTDAALEWMSSRIGERRHVEYLLNDLIEDEAISSSQLEGAATTTKAAKDMLKRKRSPRDPDEKMIIGNFRMMQLAWQKRHEPISIELISDLHRTGVDGIDDDHYRPGSWRQDDSVVVVDGDGNTVHTPPPAVGLEQRLQAIVEWVNSDHCTTGSNEYIHPLVKAIVLHFAIGYEHPFHDGNGRVARSLFYWLMFKYEFGAFRYITISTLLKQAPIQYGKSYLYTETDALDLTYFVDYQCSIVTRAIGAYMAQYKQTLAEIEAFNGFLYDSGIFRTLNDKQKTLLQVAKSGREQVFTAQVVRENLGCSYNTAASALNGLVEKKLFIKERQGRESHYRLLPLNQITKNWVSTPS